MGFAIVFMILSTVVMCEIPPVSPISSSFQLMGLFRVRTGHRAFTLAATASANSGRVFGIELSAERGRHEMKRFERINADSCAYGCEVVHAMQVRDRQHANLRQRGEEAKGNNDPRWAIRRMLSLT